MRRSLLILAALSLLLGPPALAAEPAVDESSCPPPEITHAYDTEQLRVHVKLLASGCPAREHRMFMVSASITRFDDIGPTESIDRSVMCGPFPAAEDHDPEYPPAQYFCEVEVALDHPAAETIKYDIDVGYPGATSPRNRTVILACSSDDETAACDA